VAELAIRTIDCGIVAMAAPGYGGPSPEAVPLHKFSAQKINKSVKIS